MTTPLTIPTITCINCSFTLEIASVHWRGTRKGMKFDIKTLPHDCGIINADSIEEEAEILASKGTVSDPREPV